MRSSDLPFSIRRILVALDASPHSLAALDAAANLAAMMDAELEGLFVEDSALLRLTELPCARELLYFSSEPAPLTRAGMESRLRAQSEQARKALEASARRAQIEWSFRTVRGEVAAEVMAAAGDVDLLAMGKGGWSLARKFRAGSTALELSQSPIPVLLLPESGLPSNAPLMVYYDGSPAARRGLLYALQLREAGMDGITVLLEAANQDEAERMQGEIKNLTQDRPEKLEYRQIDLSDPNGLMHALEKEEEGVLILGGREFLKKLHSLDAFLRETKMSLLLLGNAPSEESE